MNFINILKKQNGDGVLRKSNILGNGWSLAECIHTFNSIKELLTDKDPFFRDDYSTEVSKVIRIIRDKTKTFGDCAEFFSSYPEQRKQTLQHLYTFDESLFNKLRESRAFQNKWKGDKHGERDELYNKFIESMNKTIDDIESTTNAEFGYCEKCKKYLDKEQKKKYPDLEKIDQSFWDYTEWS